MSKYALTGDDGRHVQDPSARRGGTQGKAAAFPKSTLASPKFIRLKWVCFVLTFAAYTSFHLSRKPASIVKNVLHPSSPNGASEWNNVTDPGWAPFNQDLVPQTVATAGFTVSGAGSAVVNGQYTCGPHKIDGDGICETFWKDGKNETRMHRIGVHNHKSPYCWVFETGPHHTAPVYAQLKGARHVPCPQLPLITKNDINAWTLVSGASPPPTVRPSLTNGKVLLGVLDTTFLVMYALGLYVAGHIGDQVNLRWFLAFGMVMSGVFVAAQGMAYWWDIHTMGYFVGMYAVQGLFQAIGWPSVVGVMGSWFGQKTRGLAMGIWNAHTSCGNILGSIVSTAALSVGMDDESWPYAFVFCGAIIFCVGLLVAAFLVAHPHDASLASPNDFDAGNGDGDGDDDGGEGGKAGSGSGSVGGRRSAGSAGSGSAGGARETSPLLDYAQDDPRSDIEVAAAAPKTKASGGMRSFVRALCIPGVVEFALSLFFCKLVAYTFIYWLPLYLSHISYSTEEAGYLSTFFDLGGIVGGITAGWLSDRVGMRAVVAVGFLVAAVPGLYFYRVLTAEVRDSSMSLNILFMLVCGAIVNGPYALITTAVSADLGTHPSLKGDAKLLASVTGIIDGTGSVGAAIQGVLISYISSHWSWTAVFYALICCSVTSALMLTRLFVREVKTMACCRRL